MSPINFERFYVKLLFIIIFMGNCADQCSRRKEVGDSNNFSGSGPTNQNTNPSSNNDKNQQRHPIFLQKERQLISQQIEQNQLCDVQLGQNSVKRIRVTDSIYQLQPESTFSKKQSEAFTQNSSNIRKRIFSNPELPDDDILNAIQRGQFAQSNKKEYRRTQRFSTQAVPLEINRKRVNRQNETP